MTKNNVDKIELPELPIAGKEVGKEFSKLCDKDKCKNIHAWLIKLHQFRLEYDIYRKELKNYF